jgi:Fe-S cluster biosynthesis and repair protein YggX
MSQLQDRIEQFKKMANDDPDNELGHFRLGQLLMEDGRYDEAAASFVRTLQLMPQFSKVYQLLATCRIKANNRDEAVRVLKEGWGIADERGDKMPRDEMGRMLVELGEPLPESQQTADSTEGGAGDGFVCQRPGCVMGNRAHRLASPPLPDDLGRRIQESICADCWDYWFRNFSIKVINELRLDLSTEHGQEEYDRHMREFLGFSESTMAGT